MANVLITGVSSGIGKATKDYFLNKGHTVIALDLNDVEQEENLIFFKTDITDINNLFEIKKFLIDKKITLDLVINIAGIHKMASLVESNFIDMKKVIDVNLNGTILVNNTFHSLLNKNGRIIIVTSEVASFDPMPFNGLYNVSKTALDCYAQALRQELNLLNQKVITIRPGAIKTPLCDESINDTEKLSNNTKLYVNQANKFSRIAKKFMGEPIEPIKIAKLIYKVSLKKRPRYIYKKHQNLGLLLLNILPKRIQCFIIKTILNH